MLKINPNLFPKDGHRFKNQDGTTIVGDRWPAVVARLRAYRKRIGQAPGDPEAEVRQQACERNPGLCTQDDGQNAAMLKIATLKGRILAWFSGVRSRMSSNPFQFVPQEEADRRAVTCLGCPLNKALPDSGCSSCVSAVKQLRINVIGDRKVKTPVNHRGCSVLGEEIGTSVWLEQLTVDNSELPGFCWRKRGV